jgi:hypothetical protein
VRGTRASPVLRVRQAAPLEDAIKRAASSGVGEQASRRAGEDEWSVCVRASLSPSLTGARQGFALVQSVQSGPSVTVHGLLLTKFQSWYVRSGEARAMVGCPFPMGPCHEPGCPGFAKV